jgi:hypothetical protein
MAHWYDNMTGQEICDNCMERSGRHRYGDAACRVASFTSIAAYHATNKFLSKQKLSMPATNIVPVPFAHWYNNVKSPLDVCASCGGTAGSNHFMPNGQCLDSNGRALMTFFIASPVTVGTKQPFPGLSGQYLVWSGKDWVPETSSGSTDATHSTATKRYDQDKECPCGLLAKTCDYHKD